MTILYVTSMLLITLAMQVPWDFEDNEKATDG
jgi:hypothetical protein